MTQQIHKTIAMHISLVSILKNQQTDLRRRQSLERVDNKKYIARKSLLIKINIKVSLA